MTIRSLTAIAAFAICASPALALDKQAECQLQARIGDAIVAQRNGGSGKRKASRVVTGQLGDEAQKYASVVPLLVDDVYGKYPRGKAPQGYGKALFDQCMAYKN